MARNTGLFRKKRVAREEVIAVKKGGNTEFDESYNRLKDNLIYYSADGGHKVIQIESSIAGEGKTTLACNLSVSLALNDKKVVLVDLDFRKARVHRAFKVSSQNGIGNYVSDKSVTVDDIIKHTDYGVDLITRGKSIYNSSLVLTSERIKALIAELKERYDFVILDCPPVLLISDYINIARLSDGILFVVAAGYTRKSAVKETYTLLSKTDSKIIGAIMTFAENTTSGYSYYGRYGKYGHYGHYGHYGYGYGYYHEKDDEENSSNADKKDNADGKKAK